ncbi:MULTISPECIES: amidase family protein [Pseudanabaena]|uniref:Amidase n=2 Tax=Pseudanabaena TaxID=1152 RepID=L8MZ17_9CYAN|nr:MULTISPECIES: amidase family protein [Pseudanabaena]ELS31710.1 Amidase [Pseudanabaena biceps PCC 7429]MDG3496041.1 amidase family protein [Pseudanabaena catenata USMAC16]
MSEIADLSATEILSRYRQGELSPVEVTKASLQRIEDYNDLVNAFAIAVDPEIALAEAQASEQRWREGNPLGTLDGIPFTAKDLLLSKGLPTRRGSKAINPDQAWDEDAPAVARLREQGAILLGKTTTSEFGYKGVTDSPLNYDLLLTPTLAIAAFPVGLNKPPSIPDNVTDSQREWSPFTYIFNLTQQPAASIPIGFTKNGLPVGLQIVAAKYNDALVLQAAKAYENIAPFTLALQSNKYLYAK